MEDGGWSGQAISPSGPFSTREADPTPLRFISPTQVKWTDLFEPHHKFVFRFTDDPTHRMYAVGNTFADACSICFPLKSIKIPGFDDTEVLAYDLQGTRLVWKTVTDITKVEAVQVKWRSDYGITSFGIFLPALIGG